MLMLLSRWYRDDRFTILFRNSERACLMGKITWNELNMKNTSQRIRTSIFLNKLVEQVEAT